MVPGRAYSLAFRGRVGLSRRPRRLFRNAANVRSILGFSHDKKRSEEGKNRTRAKIKQKAGRFLFVFWPFFAVAAAAEAEEVVKICFPCQEEVGMRIKNSVVATNIQLCVLFFLPSLFRHNNNNNNGKHANIRLCTEYNNRYNNSSITPYSTFFLCSMYVGVLRRRSRAPFLAIVVRKKNIFPAPKLLNSFFRLLTAKRPKSCSFFARKLSPFASFFHYDVHTAETTHKILENPRNKELLQI